MTERLLVFCRTEEVGPNARLIETRIGHAFRQPDGTVNLHLDALPINGKLILRPARPGEVDDG